jgi:hypothetical protein
MALVEWRQTKEVDQRIPTKELNQRIPTKEVDQRGGRHLQYIKTVGTRP